VIDECQLAGFRACELAPRSLYAEIPHDRRIVLIPLAPGVGKSCAAQRLAQYALAHNHDLVIYIAPTRAIIAEIEIMQNLPPEAVVVLERRPSQLCGDANRAWEDLERRGCAALAKDTLCSQCPHLDDNGGSCTWPDQLDRIGPSTRLVIMTEQYLLLNPSLIPQLQEQVESQRTLVILDEARFLSSAIIQQFTRTELEGFRDALKKAAAGKAGVDAWLEGIHFLLDREVELKNVRRFWRSRLRRNVLATQQAGQQIFGSRFRYLAPELELLNSPVTTGQWRDGSTFEIVVRVDTNKSDVVVLAPYLDPEIVEERLARPVVSLFSDVVFRHSKSRILNVADPIGTATTLSCREHFTRVVDFVLALTMRNAAQGRKTVLVTRKKFLDRVRDRIEEVSAALDRPLQCVLACSDRSLDYCKPEEIALINYGIVGVNSLQSFDALYCIGGYYARSDHLNAVYQQSLPPSTRMPIGLRMEGRRRRVYAADGDFTTRHHARRAQATHHLIERQVVLQAIGRVRPFTSPAEIVLFQCDDFLQELGPIEEFASLGVARRALHVPTLARMRRAAFGEHIRALCRGGKSLRAVAAELGISVSTASVATREERLDDLLQKICS
jgi:hypothetical protein